MVESISMTEAGEAIAQIYNNWSWQTKYGDNSIILVFSLHHDFIKFAVFENVVTFLPSRVHFRIEYLWTDGKVERAMSLQEVDEYNLYCLLIFQRDFFLLIFE
jgi:hypothetical protein